MGHHFLLRGKTGSGGLQGCGGPQEVWGHRTCSQIWFKCLLRAIYQHFTLRLKPQCDQLRDGEQGPGARQCPPRGQVVAMPPGKWSTFHFSTFVEPLFPISLFSELQRPPSDVADNCGTADDGNHFPNISPRCSCSLPAEGWALGPQAGPLSPGFLPPSGKPHGFSRTSNEVSGRHVRDEVLRYHFIMGMWAWAVSLGGHGRH